MFLVYNGMKEELKLTRPELAKKYTFKGKEPVKVDAGDGKYLLKEFGRSFSEVDAPAKGKGKAKSKPPAKGKDDAMGENGSDGKG